MHVTLAAFAHHNNLKSGGRGMANDSEAKRWEKQQEEWRVSEGAPKDKLFDLAKEAWSRADKEKNRLKNEDPNEAARRILSGMLEIDHRLDVKLRPYAQHLMITEAIRTCRHADRNAAFDNLRNYDFRSANGASSAESSTAEDRVQARENHRQAKADSYIQSAEVLGNIAMAPWRLSMGGMDIRMATPRMMRRSIRHDEAIGRAVGSRYCAMKLIIKEIYNHKGDEDTLAGKVLTYEDFARCVQLGEKFYEEKRADIDIPLEPPEDGDAVMN